VGGVLANETEGLFTWQFGNPEASCPPGCVREGEGDAGHGHGHGGCVKGEGEQQHSGMDAEKDEL
jgi:hypothetical protein